MRIEIHEATQNDVTDLVKFNREVQERHAILHPKIFRSEIDLDELSRQWSEAVGDADKIVAIAKVDGDVAGYLYCELQNRPPGTLVHARNRLYIHHVAVGAQFRRQGVATALMKYAYDAAVRAGIVDILLDAWVANLEAMEFFRTKGFEPINVILAKTLE